MAERKFKVRYSVEPWGKVPASGKRIAEGGYQVSKDHYGYADDLVIVSIARKDDGSVSSVLLGSSQGHGPYVPLELLEIARDQITHQIEHHT